MGKYSCALRYVSPRYYPHPEDANEGQAKALAGVEVAAYLNR